MRLIDYDAAIDRYYAEYEAQCGQGDMDDIDWLKKCLEEAPAIRQENSDCAVNRGHWIDRGWDGDFSWRIDGRGNCWKVIECSECGRKPCGGALTARCPHCGAKMDLTDEA